MKHTPQDISYGYCQCGCGQKTKIARNYDRRNNIAKGEPRRFIKGHHARIFPTTAPLNPIGICQCGCGQPAPIAKKHNVPLGHIKGQPVRYIIGHHVKLQPRTPVEERFWKKVEMLGPDECWLWTGSHDQHGYGQIRIGGRNGGRAIKTHRFSYALQKGPIPDDLDCLHKCDNPPCVNPNHLFLGTAKDNHDDMMAKGRGKNGEKNALAHHSNAQVRYFREQFSKASMTMTEFARLHDIPFGTMRRILKRETYQDA